LPRFHFCSVSEAAILHLIDWSEFWGALQFGFGKLVADASEELRKPVEFMTYTVISAQAFEFHNRNYLSSALSYDE